jgi:hypothetical protein
MFCTVDDVCELLQIEIVDLASNQSCVRAIEEATEAIKNWCHQEIEQISETITIDCAGGTRIHLPQLPVTAVTKVVVDGIELTASVDYKLGQHGILYRVNGYWPGGIQNVAITYTHGYAVIPEDIVGVCARSASRVYQAGLRAKEQDGVMGVASLTLGDYSVTYGAEGGGGVGEGVLGVSAARVLLLSEKDILNRYRYWTA